MRSQLTSVLLIGLLLFVTGCSTQAAADGAVRAALADDDSSAVEAPSDETPSDEPSDELASDDGDDESGYDRPPPHDLEYDISEVYAQVCADCHGQLGAGDGPAGEGFAFDNPADRWTNGPTADGILKTLEDGIHDTAMRDFPQFKDVDRVALAEYILDLRYALDDGGDE